MPTAISFVQEGRKLHVSVSGHANFRLACALAERDMGLSVKHLGSYGSSETSSVCLLIPEGDLPDWESSLRARLSQPEEDAYIEHGQGAGEPDFSGLNTTTSSEALRKWVLAYYKAIGITDEISYMVIRHASSLAYVTLPLSRFKAIHAKSVSQVNPVKVSAYAKVMRAGAVLPPLIARQRSRLELLEGFHRLHALFRNQAAEARFVLLQN